MDWLTDMRFVQAADAGALDRYVGYYGPYARSHEALDEDPVAYLQAIAMAPGYSGGGAAKMKPEVATAQNWNRQRERMLLVADGGFMRDSPMPINISSLSLADARRLIAAGEQQVAEAAVTAFGKSA